MIKSLLLALLLCFVVVSVSSAQTPTPPPPDIVQVVPFAGVAPCQGDFVECYGDSFAKSLLVMFTVFIGSIVGVRQKLFLLFFFVAFMIWFLPVDVFGFWYMLFVVLVGLVDVVRGAARD